MILTKFNVFPQIISNLYVYVEYDVITTHTNGDNSTITNRINTPISSISFANGKAYSLKLSLGMTSVKVEAEVDEWPDPEEETLVDLPKNTEETI